MQGIQNKYKKKRYILNFYNKFVLLFYFVVTQIYSIKKDFKNAFFCMYSSFLLV